MPKERGLYRTLERIGEYFPMVLEKYQNLIKNYDLVEVEQIIDFSSTYLEGKKSMLGEFGYQGNRPDRL